MTSRNQARRHKGRNRMVPKPPRHEHTELRTRLDGDSATTAIDYWTRHENDPLFVYFIQEQNGGPVKIGKARNPVQRLRELQCGNPEELIVRAVLLATEDAEDKLHTMWGSVRVRGEWFGGGLEFALLELARQASAWQIAEHQAAKHNTGHGTYWIAAHGCGRVAFPTHRIEDVAA